MRPQYAAAAAFDILVRFIRTALRTLLVVGLIVAVGAFFTGPSAAAVATRSAFSSGLGRLRRAGESAGLSTGPVGTWTYSCRHALRIEAVALAALIFAFWGHPTAAVTIVIAVLLLVALGVIELIGARCWGTSGAIGRAPRARPVVAERLPVAFRWGKPGTHRLGEAPGSPSRSDSGGGPASGVLDIHRQALLDRVRPAKVLKPWRDLGVVQVGMIAAAGADDLECVGVAAFHPAVHEAGRLTPQPCWAAVAWLARGRECPGTLAVCAWP